MHLHKTANLLYDTSPIMLEKTGVRGGVIKINEVMSGEEMFGHSTRKFKL